MQIKTKKTLLFILSLVILLLAVFALLQLERNVRTQKRRSTIVYKARVLFANLADNLFPARRRPISTMELEEHLKADLPVPFAGFSQENWDWFWKLLFANFQEDTDTWPKRMRQLNRAEIENELMYNYADPFASFSPIDWNTFWQANLRGRVF